MLVVRVKRFIYQNIRTIPISESQKPTNILQKSAHSSQCTLFVKRLNESLGGWMLLSNEFDFRGFFGVGGVNDASTAYNGQERG